MKRLATMALLILGACAGETHDISLEVTGSCAAAELADVSVLSVELYGKHEGRPCALARRCLFDVQLTSIEDVAAALAAVNQPLIDVTDPDAHTMAVIGHASSCFSGDDQLLRGGADLADVTGGVLEVSMGCQTFPSEEILFCP